MTNIRLDLPAGEAVGHGRHVEPLLSLGHGGHVAGHGGGPAGHAGLEGTPGPREGSRRRRLGRRTFPFKIQNLSF